MRLKKESIQHLQGVALLLMGGICHKVGADGACIPMLIRSEEHTSELQSRI